MFHGLRGAGASLVAPPLAPPPAPHGMLLAGGAPPMLGGILPKVPLLGPPLAPGPGHDGHGPWLMGAIHSAEMLRVLQVLPCFLEVTLHSAVTGVNDCQGIFQVVQTYAPTANGIFAEGMFLGASDPTASNKLGQLWALTPPPVLHFCFGDVTIYVGAADWPGRATVHINTLRSRSAASLVEPWLPGFAALVGALGAPAGGPSLRGTASPLFAGLTNVAEPRPVGTTVADDSDRVKEMKEKLQKLKRELAKGDLGRSLVTRAQERRRSRSRSRSHSSSSVKGSSVSGHRSGGVQATAASQPGALFLSGLQNMARYLTPRSGTASGSHERGDDDTTLSVSAVTWLLTIYYATNPPASLGIRNSREMRTICECIDALLDGRLAHLGDLLMQRLKALQTAHQEGSWETARFLELIPPGDVVLPSEGERRSALRDRSSDLRLSRGHVKGSGGRSHSPF